MVRIGLKRPPGRGLGAVFPIPEGLILHWAWPLGREEVFGRTDKLLREGRTRFRLAEAEGGNQEVYRGHHKDDLTELFQDANLSSRSSTAGVYN